MTEAQLITELEKRGVLTWGKGDIALHHGTAYLVTEVRRNLKDQLILDLQRYGGVFAKDCTHSTDDPRLLGRVLRELESILLKISKDGDQFVCEIGMPMWSEGGIKASQITGHWGDTLLEAALKALLAKVEGEEK